MDAGCRPLAFGSEPVPAKAEANRSHLCRTGICLDLPGRAAMPACDGSNLLEQNVFMLIKSADDQPASPHRHPQNQRMLNGTS